MTLDAVQVFELKEQLKHQNREKQMDAVKKVGCDMTGPNYERGGV